MSATVEPWLREILRCPACRSTLLDVTDADAGPGLRCTGDVGDAGDAGDASDEGGTGGGCRRTYRFEGGVPVLLVDEGVLPGEDAGPDAGVRPGEGDRPDQVG